MYLEMPSIQQKICRDQMNCPQADKQQKQLHFLP